ncbi:MAG: galactokinase [Chloroflexi bacterium]|nr:galactokinase [Chloroflexota bacterium]
MLIRETERARRLLSALEERFGAGRALVFRAPGRVNLLGEHTDYNEGFVLPIAIDRSVLIAARPRSDRIVNVHSLNLRRSVSFALGDKLIQGRDKFTTFVRGIAVCLESLGHRLSGMDAVLEGNVPIGEGLSSSAALEMALVLSFESVSRLEIIPGEKARIGQRVENEFIGVQSGIMDQLVSLTASRGHAVLIDCRDLSYRLVPMDTERVKIVVCDSGVRRSLAQSEYNRRREQCREGVAILAGMKPRVTALRDITSADLEALGDSLPELLRRRCRHVVSENERVLQGVRALEIGDRKCFGELMCRSHQSLRYRYEVSCWELDRLVEAGMGVEGCLGSRMTGAGFGGCTVSLVEVEVLDDFARRVGETYRKFTGREARIWVCEPAEGAGAILDLGDS